MNTINDEVLLSCNRRGLIPGPQESEQDFLRRLSNLETFSEKIGRASLFDINVDWVPVTYSNRKLSFWEGAATWIEGHKVHIQLKETLKKGKLLFSYSKEELLDHEYAHAARITFEEPKFEEFLAYQTSEKSYRRYFGPLFSKTWEAIVFIILFFLPLLGQEIALFCIPFAFTSFLLIRLVRKHFIIKRCIKNLKSFVKDKQFVMPVLFRMTDFEITFFAQKTWKEIKEYMKSNDSLRWRIISLAYLKALE